MLTSTLSPFAPAKESGEVEEGTEGRGAGVGYHGNEALSSGGGVKDQMNLLDQVLHSDCKPVLEFTMVK